MAVVIKLSLFQLVFTLFFSILLAFFISQSHGYSAFLGGSICAFANLFFAGKLFFKKETDDPKKALQYFYRSESLKIAFTLAMFVLVFSLLKIDYLTFIIGYSFAALLNLLCLPFLKS